MFLSSLLADEAVWYPVIYDSPLNLARFVFFWLTVALVAAFALSALLLNGKQRAILLKYGLFGAVAYACVAGVVLLALTFAEDEIEALLFYPLLVLLAAIGGSAVLLAVKRNKICYLVAGILCGCALVATLVCMGVLFASGDSLWNNWIVTDDETDVDYGKVSQLGLYLSAGLLIAAIVLGAIFLGKGEEKGFDAKSLAFAGVCVAMSFALSYLRVVKMPQGGSITVASLLPLIVYSYMFGVRKGVFAGMVYGLLQAFQDPYILHPAQFVLDYPAAFACIGFAGVFAKVKKLDRFPQIQIALGGIVAGIARFVCHYLSGCFAFGAFAPAGQPVWLYSLIYQSGYVLPDIAIAIVAGVLVFSSPSFAKAARKYRPKKSAA